ncbi:hypothetical protein [Thermostaphylospora chromogena]|nr:hypothetical protein [Thermostaphylospora chromogena]
MSVGALALAVGGMSLTAGPASAAASDCDRYGHGGLVSSITGGLCELVSGVKQTAEDVLIGETGERIERMRQDVKDGIARIREDVDRRRDRLLNRTEPDGQDVRTPEPRPRTSPPRVVETPIGVICLPGASSAACDTPQDGTVRTPRPTDTAGREHGKRDENHEREARDGRERRDAREKRRTERERATWALPAPTPSPSKPRPRRDERAETEREPAPVDVDRPRVDLLWPYTDGLHEPMRLEPGPVKPSPAADTMGTALTAALLMSAILAARIGYARRGEHDEHIPFEPLRGRNNGRHRLA